MSERISGYCEVTLESMAYAGTGDVLMVQKMLSIVGEHIEVEEGESWKARHSIQETREVCCCCSSCSRIPRTGHSADVRPLLLLSGSLK